MPKKKEEVFTKRTIVEKKPSFFGIVFSALLLFMCVLTIISASVQGLIGCFAGLLGLWSATVFLSSFGKTRTEWVKQ